MSEFKLISVHSIIFIKTPFLVLQVPLGTYPDEYFDEASPKKMKKQLQTELSFLSEFINTRNSKLKLPYIYLNPTNIENSITI